MLGASTAIALHSLCVIPQLVQQNRTHSPMVRNDQGSESIDDSSITPSQTGHGRLKSTVVISWSDIWHRREFR
jgi:hypothetical protein